MDDQEKTTENPETPTATTPPENETYETPPDYTASQYAATPPPGRKINKRFIYLIAAALLLLVVFGAFRMLGSNNQEPEPSPTPSVEEFAPIEETPTPEEETVEPTPTPTPDSVDEATGLDRADLSVRVENGSGVTGAAKKAADYLTGLGYNVVSTGNADNTDYTDVTIRVKSSQKDFLPLLNKDLSKEYEVGATSSDLSATSSAEALVIVGK